MGLSNMDMRFKITKVITCDVFLFLLLLAAAALPLSSASFGFDSSNSCSPNGKLSRRGRAQMLAAIPCDLGQQAFCHLPGSAYPWHAVRRFVHENQGLMKRMYGDVRHISILRDEFHNNEVDVDDMESTAERYTKDGRRAAKYMMHSRDREDFGGYKSGNDVLMEPHFRPVSTTTTTTATPSTTSSTTTTSTTAKPTAASASTATSTTTEAAALKAEAGQPLPESSGLERPSLESNSVYEPSSTSQPPAGDNIQIVDSPLLGLRNLSSQAAAIIAPTTAKPAPPKRQRPTTTSTTTTTSAKPESKEAPTTTPVATLANSTVAAPLPPRTVLLSNVGAGVNRNVSLAPLQPFVPALTTPVTFASLFSQATSAAALNFDKLRRPAAAATNPPTVATKPVVREGQLFQDAMKQEPVAVSSSMRGVNACPVKDEVVAPFWANNTRGEVLALLNLYPFEQYVHWEKCTHEFKQMFCRDGCRCEQQYRLHRLLAYDPHNECRGIFSDWFRFPSSCICKCYNIPMEFRATSRSPRSDSRFDAPPPPAASLEAVEAAQAEVQRAIYEHATEQWYRPREELDLSEG